MPTTKPRCTITCDEKLYKEIEDYRFNNRYKSESVALIALLKLGLQAIENMDEDELNAWVEQTKGGEDKDGKK